MTSEHKKLHSDSPSHDSSWLEKPSTIRLLVWGLGIACTLSLVSQLVFPMSTEQHPAHFPGIEKLFGFQALFGFVAFVVIVYLGTLLRLVVKRDEDYYDS